MELIRGLYNWQPYTQGCVATIGNFDGVHLGHQAIFRKLSQDAADANLPAVAISFQPLPHEFFNPTAEQQRLQTFRDRFSSISACGIDRLLLLRFDQQQASQSADDFIHATLLAKLGVKHLLVGDDFRFGAKRAGDIALLRQAASGGAFTVADTATVAEGEQRVSSTRLRKQLEQGELQQAAQLLGRAHRISGRVIHGEKVGRQLGFPTANIALKQHKPLLRGVFAVKAVLPDGQSFPAVANLGERPTVGGRKLLLEVHLLDQSMDLYGERLNIDFYHYIRGEKKFASLDELKQAISNDADTARDFFRA